MDALMNSRSDCGVVPDRSSSDAEQVALALQNCGYRDLRGLDVAWHDGIVTIQGRVRTFFLKQMAQTVVARVPGVMRILNQVNVSE